MKRSFSRGRRTKDCGPSSMTQFIDIVYCSLDSVGSLGAVEVGFVAVAAASVELSRLCADHAADDDLVANNSLGSLFNLLYTEVIARKTYYLFFACLRQYA